MSSKDLATTLFSTVANAAIEPILELLDNQVTINFQKTIFNEVIPFTGTFKGIDEARRFFTLRGQTSKTLEATINSINGAGKIAYINLTVKGECTSTGVEFLINDLHQVTFGENHKVIDWCVYADLGSMIAAFSADLPDRLLKAVSSDNSEDVAHLLRIGANPNVRDSDSGLTALMIASCRANADIVSQLIKAGADIYTADSFTGATALHKACQGQSKVVGKLLTDAGAFIDAVTPTMGHTVIMDALWYKAPEMVNHIVSCKPNLETKTHYGFTLWDHLAYETGVQGTEEGKAVMNKISDDLTRYRDECNSIIKEQSIMAATEKGDIELVKKLIKEGQPINTVYQHVNSFSDGHTPLIVAARDNHPEIVEMLLDAGAEVDVYDWVFKGYPIHKATYNGRPDILKTLLDSPKMTKKVVNVQGKINGYTPLIDALWHGFVECADILLAHPDCELGYKGHDGKNELDISLQVFGPEHHITKIIQSRI
jgi:ankyrin repeat protein